MIINGETNNSNMVALGKLWRAEPLEIAKGNVEDYSYINKFGNNPAVGTGGADIWGYGGFYTFSTTADIDTLSSSSALDTQSITVVGLDTNWNQVTQTVTLNGQSKVTLTTPLIRAFRMYNNSATSLAGVVYLYVDDTITAGVPNTATKVRAIINNGNNQTLMCIYSVPVGKTAYFLQGYVALSNKNAAAATLKWSARLFGGAFRIQSVLALNSAGSSTWQYRYAIPPALPEKSDIMISAIETSATVAISGGFDILLMDNDE